MRNIARKDGENSLDLVPEYQENKKMEALRIKTFHDEYTPDAIIDFQKIKDFIIEKENKYWKMRDYNYNLMDPKKLCDMFIQHPPKKWSISFLESLPKDTKRCIADIFLELIPFESVQQKSGIAMLFRIRFHGYFYSEKREYLLKDFLISTPFVGTLKNYELLKKAHLAQRQLHRLPYTIDTTLLLFEIMKHLSEDIGAEDIQTYLKQKLGDDFSLGALYARQDSTKGKEQEWYGKNIDTQGNTLHDDVFHGLSIYEQHTINDTERNLKVVNRKNPDRFKDLSGSAYRIYLDGPLAIGLFHTNKPVALISFSLQNADTLFIHQMQGITAEHFDRYGRMTHQKIDPIIQTLPRQEALYDVVTLLAKKYQCKKIILQSGENNEWIHKPREELQYSEKKGKIIEVYTDQMHLSLDIAQQIYDVFAQKHGFKKNKKSKDRDKKI